MVRATLLVVGFLLAHEVWAHTGLASSEPSAGATVAAPIAEIVLTFSGEVRLTAVGLTDSSGAEKTLGAFTKETAARFVISVEEALAVGDYTIVWRAVGADTHVVSGEIRFSVIGPRLIRPAQ
jgi:methionine-rich copper-binding protein CopC